ncbi:MAG: S41 family peptidase [Patescibacteria group bacterium]
MNDFFKYRAYVFSVLMAIGLVFFAGYYIGQENEKEQAKFSTVLNKDGSGEIDFSAFWKAWSILDERYVAVASTTEKVDNQARVYGAIEGMVASLGDPYTVFFPPVESKIFEEEISGNFGGVGMEVGMKDEILTVIAPLKDTPAYKAGIKAGDKIIKIDDVVTAGLNTSEAIKKIRGEVGTAVVLTLAREDVEETFDIKVVRGVINIPTIDTKIKNDVFVISLYNFSAISSNAFRGALRDFVESGKHKMIIDLRGNPGGYLEAAIDMASWFLPPGKVVVKEDFKNEADAQLFRSKGYNIFNENLKLVVLIDEGSASASEILAGALQEHGVATLVGQKSFGKGSVQELIDITETTSLKVTIAQWLTPNGKSISNGGLTPDVEVELDVEKFKEGVDTQLEKAIEILNK